jgi:hypothetical protein
VAVATIGLIPPPPLDPLVMASSPYVANSHPIGEHDHGEATLTPGTSSPQQGNNNGE